jgi:hypothetical protein
VVAVLSSDECAALVSDAEAYAAQWGWTTSRHTFSKVFSTRGLSLVNRLGHLLLRISAPPQKRHKTHATTDIPVQLLPEGGRIWNGTLAPRVQRAIASGFGFRPESVTPVDVFLVKYESREGGQRELSVHRDGALMTFSLLLNDPTEFTGGGTYFEESGRVYRPAQGVAVVHSGKLRHGGFPITGGTRYVLVGFCLVEHEKVTPELKDWRWGEPGWYLRYVFCLSRSAAAGHLCGCSCVCSCVRACLRAPEDAQLRWQVPSMHALYISQSIYLSVYIYLLYLSIDLCVCVCMCLCVCLVPMPFMYANPLCSSHVCVCVCVCVCVFVCALCLFARAYACFSSGVVRDAELLDRIYNPNGMRRATETSPPGSHASHAQAQLRSGALSEARAREENGLSERPGREGGAVVRGTPVVKGTPGAENPKYRQDALRRNDLCRQRVGAGGGGIVICSREVREGLRVDLTADLKDGHVTSLLVDTASGSDQVIGHVVANDAGTSDVDLDLTLDTLFPHPAHVATASSRAMLRGEPPGTLLMRVANKVFSTGKALVGGSLTDLETATEGGGGGDRRIVGLVSIVVDRDVRQRGLGRLLMRETMSFYREVGFDYVLLQQRDVGSGRCAPCP